MDANEIALAETSASPFFSMGRMKLPTWLDTTKPPAILAAMGKVMKGIEAIGKNRENQQGWMFRGIDDVYNALHALLAENEVITSPAVSERTEKEGKSKSGAVQVHVVVRVEYWFTSCVDGSQWIVGPVYGEAIDTSDKATNKAMSFAQKYALLQCFTIPTKDMAEGDKESIERGTTKGSDKQDRQREPGEDSAGTDVITPDTAKKVYQQFGELGITRAMLDAKIGYSVEGLEVAWLETLRGWRDECKNKANIERLFGGAKTEGKT